MSLKVFVRDHQQQRSLALVTDQRVLFLRHSTVISSGSKPPPASAPAQCAVEFTEIQNADLSEFRLLRGLAVHGTLGLIKIGVDLFICLITAVSEVADVRPGEIVRRILAVEFYGLSKGDFDEAPTDDVIYSGGDDIWQDSLESSGAGRSQEGIEHPCFALKKLLGDGSFYYSISFDLTNSLQHRSAAGSAFDIDSLSKGFLWNAYLIDPLIEFRSRLSLSEKHALDETRILTSVIRGHVSSFVIPASHSPLRALASSVPSRLILISRLSCRRAGTRFNSRGIDDEGNVANFVESETVFWYPSGLCFSYMQIRGSIPVFWEQSTGLLPQQQKIHLTRSLEATQPAFDKHFEDLERKYGAVHVLNLLSKSKQGETDLTSRYNYHIAQSSLNKDIPRHQKDHAILRVVHYDFHAETKGTGGYEGASMIRSQIKRQANAMGYFLVDRIHNAQGTMSKPDMGRSTVTLQQEGVFRTNCLDCLDRTNLIQTILSQMALEMFLHQRREHPPSDFLARHGTLWADNGDALSKIYAGTGALKSSFTRQGKMSIAGALADARKSATRIYVNNFMDKGRQVMIDTLLGRLMDQSHVHLYDPITDFVNVELAKRQGEFISSKRINLWAGTFNLNGKGSLAGEDLAPWLWPDDQYVSESPDIVVVAFQEIVELSPQQIMSTDPGHRLEWEVAIEQTLNNRRDRCDDDQYVLLRSGQLVGAALVIYVKTQLLGSVKNVEGAVKKTGLQGMAGNKGAVAIRMDIANSRVCFVTGHLAAGFSAHEERNRDYATIDHGLRFQRDRAIEDHDMVIWLGDFNYRIELPDEQVRSLIYAHDYDGLYQHDQLNHAMSTAAAFPYYLEGEIKFSPTYKYDNGTDTYDTSDKQRIPAWCDRILYKGKGLRELMYDTAPLRFSDHRPVYARFHCTLSVADELVKSSLSELLYRKRKLQLQENGETDSAASRSGEAGIAADCMNVEIPSQLTDQRKWWLRDGEFSLSWVH